MSKNIYDMAIKETGPIQSTVALLKSKIFYVMFGIPDLRKLSKVKHSKETYIKDHFSY